MKKYLFTIIAIMLCGTFVYAAPPKHVEEIKGFVLDESGDPVSGVKITVQNEGKSIQVTSSSDGFYAVPVKKGAVKVACDKYDIVDIEVYFDGADITVAASKGDKGGKEGGSKGGGNSGGSGEIVIPDPDTPLFK